MLLPAGLLGGVAGRFLMVVLTAAVIAEATTSSHVLEVEPVAGGIAAALAKRRQLGPLARDVVIVLQPGVHRLAEPLVGGLLLLFGVSHQASPPYA